MALTDKQRSRYFREWSAVCRVQGWKSSDDDRRYALHAAAGCPQSMRKFDNAAFDKFLAQCAALQNKVDIRDRDRERHIWRVKADAKKAGLDTAYLARICADLYDREDWEDLPDAQLENFRNTIHNRARRHGVQTPRTAPSMEGNAPSFPTSPDEDHDAAEPSEEPAYTTAVAGCVPPGIDDDMPF